MAQHDNGRRPGGTQSGAWQQGQREQQGGHHDGSSTGHQNQFDSHRGQQGDNWRERQAPSGSYGGQGSFGGQASDNDYGNRGITESGNFGNYGGGREDSYARQRHDSYRHGYDARSDSTGGDWNAQRAWRDEQRYRGGQGQDAGYGSSYGQSSADNYQGNRGGPGNQDRYGDNGYQGNFQQGQRGQAYHDPDYHQWRSEQLSRLDREYDEWRQHRYQRFADEFDQWRSSRGATQADATQDAGDKGKSGDVSSASGKK